MRTLSFSAGDVIFREGDFAHAMYDIQKGGVGIWLDYDTEQKKQLTVLKAGQLLGEMGLIENSPRSATALAAEDGTVLREIGETEFSDFFRDEPERMLQMLRQLSARIRENTVKYQETCRALAELDAAEKAGRPRSEELDRKLREIGETAKKKRTVHSGLHSSFLPYVMDDLAAYEGKRDVVRVGLVERLIVHSVSPKELHANPDDEFADPNIGPSDNIIGEYSNEIPRLYCERKPIFPSPIVVYKMAADGYLILNGHHRWAAAIKSGQKKVRISIINPS